MPVSDHSLWTISQKEKTTTTKLQILWTPTHQKKKKQNKKTSIHDVIIFAWSPSGQVSPRPVLGQRFSHVDQL